MIDPVYTLVRLVDLDPDINKIDGVAVQNMNLIVWYTDEGGTSRHISKRYELQGKSHMDQIEHDPLCVVNKSMDARFCFMCDVINRVIKRERAAANEYSSSL